MNLAKSIKYALIERGMTQAQLAEKVGSKPAYISNLATGRSNLQGDMLSKVAAAFGMKVSEFVKLGED